MQDCKPFISEPGPITHYIQELRKLSEAEADGLIADLRDALKSDHGVKILKILQIAVQERVVSRTEPPGALTEDRAQKILVGDLNRIADNGRYIRKSDFPTRNG